VIHEAIQWFVESLVTFPRLMEIRGDLFWCDVYGNVVCIARCS
jgi:hypothetical protein